MLFKRTFKKAGLVVEIIAKPSKYSDFNAEDWYRDREGQKTVLLEYVKIFSWMIGFREKLNYSK